MIDKFFKAPIPGQSLTTTPKNSPWERPPKFTKPDDALEAHLDKLSDPSKIKDTIHLLEMGMPVEGLTKAILTNAVMQGIHSVDVSMLIAPVIHEFITAIGKQSGIDFKTGWEIKETHDDEDYLIALVEKGMKAKPTDDEQVEPELPPEEMMAEESGEGEPTGNGMLQRPTKGVM